MASVPYPVCNAPYDITLSLAGATLTVGWKGNAARFKLRWREDGSDDAWQEQTMNGGGASGGSTYRTTAGAVANPGSFSGPVNASFSITGVIGKMYALRLVNVCPDGSEYPVKKTVLMESACPPIQNFRVVSRDEAKVIVAWDNTGAGHPYYVVPVELDAFGNERDGEGLETTNPTAEFVFLDSRRYALYVNQKCGTIETRMAGPLYLAVCGCGGAPVINVTTTGGGTPPPQDNYEHTQATPAAVWTIAHSLGYFPVVKAVDATGKEMEGVVQYQDNGHLSVSFAKPLAGKAYLS